MNEYAIVGCGASKRPQACEAQDLYTSTYFEKKRAFAEQCDRWWILSAEHGALSPRKQIEPYDTNIADVDTEAWGRKVYLALRADDCKWLGETTLYVLAGQKYIEPIQGVLDDLEDTFPVTAEYPFEGTSGIGDQLAELDEMAATTQQEGLDAFA